MDHHVGVASDGRGEVGVKGNVEGVVLEKLFLAERAGAEVERHLGRERKSTAPALSSNTKDSDTGLALSSHLHGPGTHVCEHFFPGTGILVITNCRIEALLRDAKSGTKYGISDSSTGFKAIFMAQSDIIQIRTCSAPADDRSMVIPSWSHSSRSSSTILALGGGCRRSRATSGNLV